MTVIGMTILSDDPQEVGFVTGYARVRPTNKYPFKQRAVHLTSGF
jgi:hypothetical protein